MGPGLEARPLGSRTHTLNHLQWRWSFLSEDGVISVLWVTFTGVPHPWLTSCGPAVCISERVAVEEDSRSGDMQTRSWPRFLLEEADLLIASSGPEKVPMC